MKRLQRPYALILAMLGWFALALQFRLMLGYAAAGGETLLWGVLRFFSFFTVCTNALTALSLTATALGFRNMLTRPSAQTAIVVYLVVVSTVYAILLRNLWNPSGAQQLANELLHYAIPALYLVYWVLFVPKGALQYRDAAAWLAYPVAYVVWALSRGAATGLYPYPFLDAARLSLAQVALNLAGLGAAFVALGLLAVWIGRRLESETSGR